MCYQELAQIATQLSKKLITLDEILQILHLKQVKNMMFLASFLMEIDRDGTIKLSSHFGANPDDFSLNAASISIFQSHPTADCIRSGSMICLDLQGYSKGQAGTMVVWPINNGSRALGCLVSIMNEKCSHSGENHQCLDALGILFNNAIVEVLDLSLKSNRHLSRNYTRDKNSETLSERQLLVLKMISEGRTNGDIAHILGYSESLIRQETIRIYAFLGCQGRGEAAEIYQSQFANAI